ncbi:MAG: hypothetical protein B6U95_09435 [Thermofilum sp. ex4484_82]|nr:MAG: hypothetical protein B6U95_09435 [Thermofilum sp. ex4484_82]OYT35831.1 MAG: hypothetical protein B6U96_09445 [Archaeoglobales archaeon ex4484_92]
MKTTQSLLKIFSYIPLSLIDCRTDACSLYFLSNCNMRCIYCQNYPQFTQEIPLTRKDFLNRVKNNWAIGVVKFTGGEPTLQEKGLLEAAKIVQECGKRIAIDTNGTRPQVVSKLLKFDIAEVAVDYKAPQEKYQYITGIKAHERVIETINILKDQCISFEVRTTVAEPIITLEDLHKIAERLSKIDPPLWVIQFFRSTENTPKWLKPPKNDVIYDLVGKLSEMYNLKIKIRS